MTHLVKLTIEDSVYHNIMFLLSELNGFKLEEDKEIVE